MEGAVSSACSRVQPTPSLPELCSWRGLPWVAGEAHLPCLPARSWWLGEGEGEGEGSREPLEEARRVERLTGVYECREYIYIPLLGCFHEDPQRSLWAQHSYDVCRQRRGGGVRGGDRGHHEQLTPN